ncbi:MAG: mitochondrial fission ELM1 family protein [Xanthomonadales bacterium]|nr:mitochondrial fission ELM1 family protein [Xanthomonadales bacterium]
MPQSCWIATDGAAGNEKQCLALAHYLGVEAEVFRLSLRSPWEQFAPGFRWMARLGFRGEFARRLGEPGPDLFIGCGRRAALAALALRRQGSIRTIQILNPRVDSRLFDWVVCPRHDGLQGPNVIQTTGALHRVDDDWLEAARQQWKHLAELPSPRIGVLVGGPGKHIAMDRDSLERLLSAARSLACPGGEGDGTQGSVLVTASGRTPGYLLPVIKQFLANTPGLAWTGPEDGENPYAGLMAWADRLVVSADSVNMISEALGTGRPVHCEAPAGVAGRLAAFHQQLNDRGLVRKLDDPSEYSYPPLREAPRVAAQLRQQLAAA